MEPMEPMETERSVREILTFLSCNTETEQFLASLIHLKKNFMLNF
jgi:hypothetical protein